MKIVGHDNTSFALDIVGYQFPGEANEDYDSNWLMVRVVVNHPKGAWSSTDPSLLTYELRELGEWLQIIRNAPTQSSELSFIEPNLSFRFIADATSSVVRVMFELESRPNWAPSDGAGMEDLWIDIPLSCIHVDHAVADITVACNRYPQRAVV